MEYKLILDVESFVPMIGRYGLDLHEYFEMINKTGIIMWDSSDDGMEPKIVDANFKEARLLDMGKLTDEEKAKLGKSLKDGDLDLFKKFKNVT